MRPQQGDVPLRWLLATASGTGDALYIRLAGERRATWWTSAPPEVLAEVRARVLARR